MHLKRIVSTFLSLALLFILSFGVNASDQLIKLGCSGSSVVNLQAMMIALGYMDNRCATGYFGEVSKQALMQYQGTKELKIDGVAGIQTRFWLEKDISDLINYDGVYALGDKGDGVRIIQYMLVNKGYLGSYSISGVYGQLTHNAVIRYQKDNQLQADGIVGKNTLLKLFGCVVIDRIIQDCNRPNREYLDNLYSTLNAQQRDDIYLLSQLITAEAGSEPYIGQVAVGSVVFNRMEYDDQTMQQVIFKKNAFSVVKDGKINKTPTAECRYAAIQAYFGAKPVSKARFFNMKHITNSWAATHCELYKIIGNHAFYI